MLQGPKSTDVRYLMPFFSTEYNFLAQILPVTIGSLSNLKELVLDRNIIRGSLPTEFGLMSDLGKKVLVVKVDFD